ncbi:MAG: class I SAM-dependent methyltransferase [Chloroflexota bacterium]|nr:class I SAM-dependent methyltransferase [Chloroflexota bacterium]
MSPFLPVWEDATPETYRRLGEIIDPDGKVIAGIERIVPLAGKRVADVGTGIGHYPMLLARHTGRTYGIEDDPVLRNEAARRARAAHQPNLRIVAGSPDRLPLRDAAVDVVLSGEIEPDDGSLARVTEALRVLRPGGHLIVMSNYGRDEASRLLEPELVERAIAASHHRTGWWRRHGFRIKVIHTRIDLRDADTAHELLPRLYGDRARAFLMGPHRPSLELKVALYHRQKAA